MSIERKYLAHYIDSSFSTGTSAYVRLGADLEEYNVELNPDVETKQNILGENSVRIKGYEVSGEPDPYYSEYDDALSKKILDLANERATGDACKTTVVDALFKEDGTCLWAYKEDAIIVPKSIGGDTSGVQTPFTVHYAGNRVKGTFDADGKTFTKSEASA